MSTEFTDLRRRRLLQAVAGAGFVGVAFPGLSEAAADTRGKPPTAIVRWNQVLIDAIRAVKLGPPMAARALAIVHTCVYDAWAAYHEHAVGTRLGGTLRRPKYERNAHNRLAAVNQAAYRALVDLFPAAAQVAAFDAVMAELGVNPASVDGGPDGPPAIGNRAADAVLAFRHQDGSNQLGTPPYADTTGYVPVNGPDTIADPNRWQPLRVPQADGTAIVQRFLAPHWKEVVPFALTSASQFRPDQPPVPVTDPRYRRQVEEILAYSAGLTDEQKVIAEYWADGIASETPAGHWCLLAAFISARDHHKLDDDVVMFFAVANAVFDAGIACWDCKRAYDYVRPITAVHHLMGDQEVLAWAGPYQGVRLIRGRDWRPYQETTFVTPPFAEFTSGHSTFSAAGAEVLRRFTGSDRFDYEHVQPAGVSFVEPGAVPAKDVTLRWATFTAAADEAGLSRRYGGIHFIQADTVGREMGQRIGTQVWWKVLRLLAGDTGEPT